jgi:CPA2 family monovalent cation:H+ antiporter-2
MQIDPRALAASPLQATLWLALFVLAKPVLAALALRIARYDRVDSVRAGIVLAHASELTLLILTQAMNAALLPARSAQAMLVASALSMGLAPAIIQHNRAVAVRVLRRLKATD